jgi:lipoprotein NlpD
MMRFLVLGLMLFLVACESNPPAPVIDRTPDSRPKPPQSKPATKPVAKNTEAGNDWRPDSHIVKKGDTLFGIGLEYGVDYKEIAAANNIAPPYPIQIGQKLDLSSFKVKTTTAPQANTSAGDGTGDGVVITPMKTEPAVVGDKPVVADKPIVSVVTPVLSEPKALREPYSLEALNRATPTTKPIAAKPTDVKPTDVKPTGAKPADVKPTDAKPAEAKPTDTAATGDEAITWAWPTQGKVVGNFNEATNKGIDIGGETGQAIKAASAGKVIYSGSDLRGYGKLVIVKHNKTYLSVYAHNSKIVVKEGQNVVAGQKIAEMGNTDSNSVKLHFEIRRLGKSVDPAKYLN